MQIALASKVVSIGSAFRVWRIPVLMGSLIAALLIGVIGCASSAPSDRASQAAPRFSVLVFSKTDTAGYRHASIPDGIQAFRSLGQEHYFAVEATEDASIFASDSLSGYDAVVFLNTSGDVLNAQQQAAFERYVRGGGGFMGVHAAAATEYDWTWYGGLVGAFFDDHPEIQEATVATANNAHPSTLHLPKRWPRTDEWYNFRTDPSDSVEVLLTLDESTYDGGTMGASHPIAWMREYDGGRTFYTGLGHTNESFQDPLFQRHLLKGLEWAAGGLDPFVESDFPFITTTVDAEGLAPFMPERNVAVRGIALQLGNGAYASFDPDLLRMSAGWKGDFVSMSTMAQVSYDQPNNKQNEIPQVLGQPLFGTGLYPGWMGAEPSFSDPRLPGPNPDDPGRGPIDPEQGRWNGLHVVGDKAVLSYTVRGTDVLEQPGSVEAGGEVGITRAFQTEATSQPLALVAAEVRNAAAAEQDSTTVVLTHGAASDTVTAVGVVDPPEGAALRAVDNRYITFQLPASAPAARFQVVVWTGPRSALPQFRSMLNEPVEIADVQTDRPVHWPQAVHTRGEVAPDTSAFVTDELSLPLPNPWNRNVRAADLDFFEGSDRAAVVTFSGDVWLVSGIDQQLDQLRWKRFASGLYEPLSLSIIDGDIYVYGREGIVRLHDENGDGEADFYENFSNLIIQSTETREWPLDMVPRPGGGFFLSMGGALNAGPPTGVSQTSVLGFRVGSRHAGSVTQVSADGDSIRVVADGFREPYLGTHPASGFLTASDQQGNFVPSTPIYVVRNGGYYGVPASTQREGELPDPELPLTWIPHQVDPSGASQVWVESDQMGPLSGEMVHLSYSRPGPFRVYMDTTQTPWQGGVRPIAGHYVVPTSKGQMNPGDGQLYIAGFQVWGTTAEKISSLLRLRYTGQPSREPTQMRAGEQGVLLRFEQPLDRGSATNARNYAVTRWNYRRTEQYGSGHFTLDGAPGEEELPVAAAHLSEDGTALLLVMPDVQPVMQLQLDYAITAADGTALDGPVFLTLNEARPLDLEAAGFGDVDWQQDVQRASDLIASTPAAEAVEATAKRGRHIYQEVGCVTCHSLDGSQQVGPSFQNLFGSERTLVSGETVVADEAYIEQAIWSPASQVVEGYASNMPAYEGILSEAEVESLVLFIKSLSASSAPSDGGTGASP